MLKRPAFAGFLIIALFLPKSAWAWGQEAHRMITARVLELLPASIRPFYQKHRTFVVEHSVDPDFWRNVGFTEEVPRHFLDMDAYGSYPFTALPRNYEAAVQKFGVEIVQKNGSLPWRTEEIYNQLVKAFDRQKKGNGPYALEDIKYFSAVLAHYLGDAHVPFHAVTNYDGQLTNQQGIHSRFETELFLRYRKRLSILGSSLVGVSSPQDFVFEVLLESFKQVDPILKADREAAVGRTEYDDAYFRNFAVVAKPILEHRINASIQDIASILASAWEKAGKPDLPLNPPHFIRKIRNGGGSTQESTIKQ